MDSFLSNLKLVESGLAQTPSPISICLVTVNLTIKLVHTKHLTGVRRGIEDNTLETVGNI